jgi:hypothetical protein
MHNPATLRFGRFGGADIHLPVNLHRIAVHDFASEHFRQMQR